MASIVLLHSALGPTRHVADWAEALADDGHAVVTPDMYGGDVYADLDAGVERADGAGGPPGFVDTVSAWLPPLPAPLVYAGFSLGGAVAEILALTRRDAAGLIVMHGALSPAWFGVDAWPPGLRAQLHVSEGDPWAEPEENQAFLDLAGAACETFAYPGDGHLFGFEGWHEYDEDASHRMFEHVTEFLAELDAAS